MDFITSAIVAGIFYDLIKNVAKNTAKGLSLSLDMFREALPSSSRISDDICQEFIDEVNEVEGEEAKVKFVREKLSEDNQYTQAFEQDMYPTNFAKRMDYLLLKINEDAGFGDKKWNPESIGEFLGLDSVNELKKSYTTDEEPSYAFIRMVAEKLGANPEWMVSGEGCIFSTNLGSLAGKEELEDDDSEVQEYIFAMQKDAERNSLLLIRRLDEVRYDYYPTELIFFLSSGCEGRSQLLSVYKLLQKMRASRKLPDDVHLLSEEMYVGIMNGSIYPGVAKRQRGANRIAYLLDDFVDYRENNRERYVKSYGEEFVKMHDYIEEEMKRRAEAQVM